MRLCLTDFTCPSAEPQGNAIKSKGLITIIEERHSFFASLERKVEKEKRSLILEVGVSF